MNKVKDYLKSILLPIIVGLIVGIIIKPVIMKTNLLNKPPLNPPNKLFPIAWSILYTLMGISYGILKNKNLLNNKIKLTYYLQLTFNALWSIFYFIFEWRLFAGIWLIILACIIIIMIKQFYEKNKLAGLLQIPYLLWTLFAIYLNISIYILNK